MRTRLTIALALAVLLAAGLAAQHNAGMTPYAVYGHTYVADGVASVTVNGTTYVKLTQFTTGSGVGVTWDAGQDSATILYGGVYDLSFNVSFTGTADKVYDCAVFGGSAGTTELNMVHTTAIWKSVEGFLTIGARGIAIVATNDVLSVRCHGTSAGDVMVVQDGSFVVLKLGS
jgi:hypothetical protein